GAAVDVQAERLERAEVAEPLLELRDRGGGRRLGLDDRELAVLDAGARDGAPTERAGAGLEAELGEAGDQGLDLVLRDVQHEQLLLRRQTHAPAAVRLGEDRMIVV